jgi:hypothetical protein
LREQWKRSQARAVLHGFCTVLHDLFFEWGNHRHRKLRKPKLTGCFRRLKTLEVEINWGGKGARKCFKLVRANEPQDLVFQSLRTGVPMRDGNILRRHLRPAALKLGIDPKKATWRSLRTSCATWMVEAGRKSQRRARTDAALPHHHHHGHLLPARARQPTPGRDQDDGHGGVQAHTTDHHQLSFGT